MKPVLPACFLLAFMVYLGGCFSGPSPWTPRTYPDELGRYEQDPARLPASWKKFYVEGEEENSFWFQNRALDATITVSFTCGKYMDIPLDLLADHVLFPLGRSAIVESEGYLPGGRVDIYHVRARGELEYAEPKKGQTQGPKTPVQMDFYTVGENHCVVDVVYLAPPASFERGLKDFQAALRDYGIPAAGSQGP